MTVPALALANFQYKRYIDNVKFLNQIHHYNGVVGNYDMPVIKKQNIELRYLRRKISEYENYLNKEIKI